MEWIAWEALWLGCPCLTDELIGREAFERFQSASEVVSGDEARKVLSELVVAFVVETPNGRLLDGAVHALDLTVIRYVIFGA